MHPAVFELAAIVERQRGDRLIGPVRQQNARFHEDLHTVADADDQVAGGFEFLQAIAEAMADLIAKTASRGNVVAITEAAVAGEDLIIGRQSGGYEQAMEMHHFRTTAR